MCEGMCSCCKNQSWGVTRSSSAFNAIDLMKVQCPHGAHDFRCVCVCTSHMHDARWMLLVSSAEHAAVHFNVAPISCLAHAYSWWAQTGLECWWYWGWADGGGGGDGRVQGSGGMRRACRSVSRFQTSEFFWLKSLIRFIMHILALIKVIGVWHSQCQSREPGSTSLPLCHSAPAPNECLECVNFKLVRLGMLMSLWHL